VLVYRTDSDALYEFSNDTTHGLIHLAAPNTLRVYIKSRGLFHARVHGGDLAVSRRVPCTPRCWRA